MIRVLVEVGSDTARFGVAVKAYYAGVDIQVVYPIDPESFFARNPATPLGLVELEMPESVAG
jgi:hypothetical protein